jgi:hypothetical protein
MKGKIFSLLFALPFFGVGVWMAYSISSNLVDATKMKRWQPVPATLQRAGYERHSGDDSDTYEAYARYTYEFGGQRYTGSRVAIAGGADNIGDYQMFLGNRLSQAMGRGETITVYVNPEKPSLAVVDRSIRWGLVGFKSIFVFAFGGIGLGLIVFVLRAPQKKNLTLPVYRENPWLANDNWQSAVIRSGSKNTMYFSWGFAAFWNLISAPLPFLVYSEVMEKDNKAAMLGLLFPLVGLGLLAWAAQRTLEWRRFGAAPVELDPFPGSIGGHVGGTIDINLPYDSNAQFSLSLSNLRSYVSGSGKNRSRKESAQWQDTQLAHVSSGPKGSRLSFRFDIPEELSESAAVQSNDEYFLWRLNVSADLPGADFDRDYEIPVYATREHSKHLSGFSIGKAKMAQRQMDIEAVERLVSVSHGASGRTMLFPPGRNVTSGIGGLLFGGVFFGAGRFLTVTEGHWAMGAVFGSIGLLIFLSALYFMLNSLEVMQEGSNIRSVRRILGITVKQGVMRRENFVRFEKKKTSTTQSGNKHVVRYSVSAVDRTGQKLIVGEGFEGAGQAEAAAEFIGQKFGLQEERREAQTETVISDDNYLATG